MNSLKLITVGAAIQDVFLSGKVLTPVLEHDTWFEELPLGAKLDVDQIAFSTGGGAVNAAVTFARQGFQVDFMGQVGNDLAGQAVLQSLKKEGIGTDLTMLSKNYATGYSVLLLAPNGERTILTYRGASTHYNIENFRLDKAMADWFYISSLAGHMEILSKLIEHCKSNHIKVALNPGKAELENAEQLRSILPAIEILIGNREEISSLFGGEDVVAVARSGGQSVPYLVVTDGPNGVVATDRQANQLCKGGLYEDVKVIDRTGAGDAFASGVVSYLAIGQKIHQAIVFASANSTAVVQKIGANAGALFKDTQLHGMDLQVEPLQ